MYIQKRELPWEVLFDLFFRTDLWSHMKGWHNQPCFLFHKAKHFSNPPSLWLHETAQTPVTSPLCIGSFIEFPDNIPISLPPCHCNKSSVSKERSVYTNYLKQTVDRKEMTDTCCKYKDMPHCMVV